MLFQQQWVDARNHHVDLWGGQLSLPAHILQAQVATAMELSMAQVSLNEPKWNTWLQKLPHERYKAKKDSVSKSISNATSIGAPIFWTWLLVVINIFNTVTALLSSLPHCWFRPAMALGINNTSEPTTCPTFTSHIYFQQLAPWRRNQVSIPSRNSHYSPLYFTVLDTNVLYIHTSPMHPKQAAMTCFPIPRSNNIRENPFISAHLVTLLISFFLCHFISNSICGSRVCVSTLFLRHSGSVGH